MDGASAASTFSLLIQILVLDLLLSGDNALVIAMACRYLPPDKARLASWLGAGGAIFLRFVLTAATGALMSLPFLQMIGAFPLLIVALHLMVGDDEGGLLGGGAKGDIWTAASLIVISDAAMSVDNVVALAAVSGGNIWLLLIGFLISVPLIVFGSFGFGRLLKIFPWLVDAGGALLGWIAGGLVANDPAIADWIRVQAPALQVTLPLAGALFVLIHGRASRRGQRISERAAPNDVVAQTVLAQEVLAQEVFVRESLGQESLGKEKSAPQAVAAAAPMELERDEDASVKASTEKVVFAPIAPATIDAPALLARVDAEAGAVEETSEPTAQTGDAGEDDHNDRIMLIGLAVLFAVFGLFLALFIAIPE